MALDDFMINEENEIIEVMRKIDRSGINIIFAVNKEGELCGSVTDGDIRRAIIKGVDVNNKKIKEIMMKDPVIIYEKDLLNKDIINLSIRNLLTRSPMGGFIPVINENKKIIDLLHFSEPKKESYIELNKKNDNFSLIKNIKCVLIIGGAGYLGSILARKLLEKGYHTKILDLFLFGRDSIKELEKNSNLEIIEGDVRNITTISEALENVDAVIHLAAIVGDPACKSKPLDAIETNYLATKILAEACKYRQVNRFIFASTCSVYGKGEDQLTEESPLTPFSLYARSKIKSEEGILSLMDENFSPCILRMGTLYGLSPRMRFDLVVNTLTMKAFTERKINIFGGDQWRPLLHVDDAAEAYIKCLESPIEKVKGQIFNVGSNEQNIKIIRLGELIKKIYPEIEMSLMDKETPDGQLDKRDYNVSFNKINKFLDFYAKKTIEGGIVEIKRIFENGGFFDVKDKRYYNLVCE